jgi:hypothetical protein
MSWEARFAFEVQRPVIHTQIIPVQKGRQA